MNSPVCSLTASERLKWRIIIRSDELSCLYPLCQRSKREESELLLPYDPDECCFLMLSAPHSFILILLLRLNSYWQFEASRNGELANIFLCHLVWSGTDSACSLSPNLLPQVSSSFDGDFSPTYLLPWMCGLLSWQVCLNVSDKSLWKTGPKGMLPGFSFSLWLCPYHPWPVDGDVNLLWLWSRLDASFHTPSFSSPSLCCTR